MAHVFLSSEWLDAVEVLQSAFPPRERAAPNTAVALKVTDGPDGDTELTFAAGRFRREAAPNPTATVTIDYEVAKALLVDRDQSVYRRVAMKAFGAGKLKVDGDQSAVAATLSPSPQQVEVAAKIKELTAEVRRSGFLDDHGSGSITPGEISPALRPRIDELGLTGVPTESAVNDNAHDPNNRPVVRQKLGKLIAGQSTRLKRIVSEKALVQQLSDADIARTLSWRKGELMFSGESLEEVVRRSAVILL